MILESHREKVWPVGKVRARSKVPAEALKPFLAVVLPQLSDQASGTVSKCPLPQETDHPHITSESV